MSRKYIPVEESFREWRKDPKYVAAYDALEDEFAVASALIKARGEADMTQEEVAKAMGTTQAVVARLESGKTMPSTRTLERFAKSNAYAPADKVRARKAETFGSAVRSPHLLFLQGGLVASPR